MTIDLPIKIPHWIIPERIKNDLRQRAKLTGTAMTELSFDFIGFRISSVLQITVRNHEHILTP